MLKEKIKSFVSDKDRVTRNAYIAEAGFEYFISLFVTSTFLGYILDAVGFSDAVQGIISTVATFTCGAQLYALFSSGRHPKRTAVVGHLINQVCFILMYVLPIFDLSPALKSVLLIIFLFTGHIINNALLPGKTIWFMGSVEDSKRGSFTAVKEMVSLAGGMAVSLALGAIADTYRDAAGNPTRPYYIICCVAITVLMIMHTATILVSSEDHVVERPRANVKAVTVKLFTDINLLKIIGIGLMWNVASGLSVSFFASYYREELAMPFTLITVMSTVGSLLRIAASPIVGRYADKNSFASSMTLCYIIAGFAFIAMCFTSPETKWLAFVYFSLHSISFAGINSGIINSIYDYVVPEDRAVALGVKNAIGGVASFLAALASGAILAAIQKAGGFNFFGINLYAQQVLSFLSLVVIVILVLYMKLVIMPMKRVREIESDV